MFCWIPYWPWTSNKNFYITKHILPLCSLIHGECMIIYTFMWIWRFRGSQCGLLVQVCSQCEQIDIVTLFLRCSRFIHNWSQTLLAAKPSGPCAFACSQVILRETERLWLLKFIILFSFLDVFIFNPPPSTVYVVILLGLMLHFCIVTLRNAIIKRTIYHRHVNPSSTFKAPHPHQIYYSGTPLKVVLGSWRMWLQSVSK